MTHSKRFPDGFFWGAATSAYQVEGGNDNTDWAKAAEEGKVPPAGKLADHYHLYKKDFYLAKELGHNAHRFSVEWARIEPEEGIFDADAIEHYRSVLRELRGHGIEPFITLWHFSLPLWFADSGGFERDDAPEIFARYCRKVVAELGEQCTHFSTINEPNVYGTHGWLYGVWPPFKRARILWKKIGKDDETAERSGAVPRFANIFRYFSVQRTLMRAHNAAYTAMKEAAPHAQVSVVKHVHVFEANTNPFNRLRAAVMQYLQTYRFMDAIRDHLDEIGLNYYRHTKYGDTQNYLFTDMGWNVHPSGIYDALVLMHRYGKPIYIAEAGLADEDDDLRAEYLKTQIAATHKAIEDGVDVRAHMYWSLMDNYEWALGTGKRFGLIAVDYQTLLRRVRPSAYVYKKIIQNNGIV